jgi:hypothetical protein
MNDFVFSSLSFLSNFWRLNAGHKILDGTITNGIEVGLFSVVTLLLCVCRGFVSFALQYSRGEEHFFYLQYFISLFDEFILHLFIPN